jgi:hypothetical protein
MECPCGATFVGDDSADADYMHNSLNRQAEQWRMLHAAHVTADTAQQEAKG